MEFLIPAYHCKVVKEEGGKIKEWNKEDEMGSIADSIGEL